MISTLFVNSSQRIYISFEKYSRYYKRSNTGLGGQTMEMVKVAEIQQNIWPEGITLYPDCFKDKRTDIDSSVATTLNQNTLIKQSTT